MTDYRFVSKVPSVGGKVGGPAKGSTKLISPASIKGTSKASGPKMGQNAKIVSPAIGKVSGKAKSGK